MPAVAEKNALILRLRWFTSFRVLMGFFLCLFTWIIRPGAEDHVVGQPFVALAAITALHLGVALGFFVVFERASAANPRRFAFAQIAWDVVFATLLVYLTGGIESHFRFLYWLTITNASFLTFEVGAFGAATLSAILYGALANLLYLRRVPMVFEKVWQPGTWQENEIIQSIVLNAAGFFFVAWVANHLAGTYKKSQAELEEKKLEIENMEVRVRQSEQLAAIGELAARMAHEIRNPLTSVSGAIQMLSYSASLQESEQKLMGIVLRETDRLNVLLTDFLSFAKPHAPVFSDVPLARLIQDTYDLFSKSAPEAAIEFELTGDAGCVVHGDTQQLSQVFWNLFKNAAESMEGKGKIAIHLRADGEGHTLVEVRDQGRGIPAELREKIFQPFFSTKPKGTGLGLSVVHRIVEQHRGEISVRSAENAGSVFRIRFKGQEAHGYV